MYNIQCNKEQLEMIWKACEYLWRHCIWQNNYKALMLEDRINEKEKTSYWYTLTDIRKQVEHQKAIENKSWPSNVHSYETYKMGEYELVKINQQ